MKKNLEGKIAIVTGGSRGIGRAVVENFLKSGATVYFNYSKNKSAADELVNSLNDKGLNNVYGVQCQANSSAEVKDMVQAIKNEHDQIDILVNNAGITRDNYLLRMSEEDWDRVISVNLTGMFLFTKNVISSMMVNNTGAIVNISSVAAIYGSQGHSNYAASKGGIISFTKNIATELAPKSIRVNCILPGYVQTDMVNKVPRKILREKIRRISLGRVGDPKEIAKVAHFLVSEDSSYIVGQALVVDGGISPFLTN